MEDTIPSDKLIALSSESRQCLERLFQYRAPPLPDFGVVRQAAVLIILFQRPGDDKLSMVLTTRAKTLRRHPSQTALPGGKVDPEDPHPIHTARREAFEEVNLPLHADGDAHTPHPDIHDITTLDPVLTILPLNAHLKNHIIVIPVVCFVSDPSLIDRLEPHPAEVDAIFSHPLHGCLTGKVEGQDAEGLSERGGQWWPFEEEFHSIEDRTGVTGGYRMHLAIPDKAFPYQRPYFRRVKFYSQDVDAYGREPDFDHFAAHQPPFTTAIANVVLELPGVLEQDRLRDLAGETKEVRPLEWGGADPNIRWRSGEVYETV